jgi:hypothetical protein
MEEVLLKSSQNIKLMIETLKIHEQNLAAWYKYKSEENKSEENKLADTDVSMNDTSFVERKYSSIYHPEHETCLLSHRMFKLEDTVIQIKSCKHIFDKEHFLHWINFHKYCPRCKILL